MDLTKKYKYDEEKKFWYSDKLQFNYSDGEKSEDYLRIVLSRIYNRSIFSKEIFKLQIDWPSAYHLSSLRANLLRPFEHCLGRGRRILELGCGCGAVTRYLGECGGDVLAVEGSVRRAEIAGLRCKDLDNVTFLVDNIMALDADCIGTFDVVTLIGVLEYARIYGGGPGAELRLLQKARSFLKNDGILILAIENKLGLAYFSGKPEDHTGVVWGSICSAYHDHGVRTYSRKELTALLREAGFAYLEQFVPIPDYKMPVSVILQHGLNNTDRFDAAAFLGTDTAYRHKGLFNISEAWRSVADAGLTAELADSLCFICSPCKEYNGTKDLSDILAVHYGEFSANQKKYLKKMTLKDCGGELFCLRESVFPELGAESPDSQTGIRQTIKSEPYIKGRLLSDVICNIIVNPGWSVQDLIMGFLPWYKLLLKISLDGGKSLPGWALDLAPFNCIIDEQGVLRTFDLEWAADKNVSFDIVMVRGIIATLHRIGTVARPKAAKQLHTGFLVKALCSGLGRDFTDEDLQRIVGEENILNIHIFKTVPNWEEIKENYLRCSMP